MKSVSVKISKNELGEYVTTHEANGYQGLSCEEVAQAMSSMGDLVDRKTSDSAYQLEIPVPQSVHTM